MADCVVLSPPSSFLPVDFAKKGGTRGHALVLFASPGTVSEKTSDGS